MIYNLTAPVTAARFVNIPHERSKFKQAYHDGLEGGTESAKSELDGLTMKEAREKYRDAKRRLKGHDKELAAINREWDHLTGTIAAWEDMSEWAKGFLTFEHPSGRAFQSFQESIADETIHNLYNLKTPLVLEEYQREIFDDSMIFIVEHNWFNAINRADEFASGSFRLPYDVCIFEFMVSHKSVVAICSNYSSDGAENEIVMQFAVESLAGWALSPNIYKHAGGAWGVFNNGHTTTADEGFQRFIGLIGNQIRAACIALDAEVATANLIRAPHIGHEAVACDLPEYEYYTISLARRQRVEALRSSGDTHGIKRLHFRRGHWRHYLTFKTWVRWALVGNPELGFIDKQYRL